MFPRPCAIRPAFPRIPIATVTPGLRTPSISARNSWVRSKLVAADPVLRHEQPARATLFDDVQPVARCGLGYSLEYELAVAVQESPEPRAFLRQVAKIPGRQSSCRTGDLAADFVFRSLDAVKNRNPCESVVANCHGLDLVAVFHQGD